MEAVLAKIECQSNLKLTTGLFREIGRGRRAHGMLFVLLDSLEVVWGSPRGHSVIGAEMHLFLGYSSNRGEACFLVVPRFLNWPSRWLGDLVFDAHSVSLS